MLKVLRRQDRSDIEMDICSENNSLSSMPMPQYIHFQMGSMSLLRNLVSSVSRASLARSY
jgi:hypothetical protein